MNHFTAVITGQTLVLVERNGSGLVCQTIAEEARPTSFVEADMALAFHSYGRTSSWELAADGTVVAGIAPVDNRFNGVPAARFDEALGSTHADEFELVLAATVENGDLVTDAEFSAVYVVAGSESHGHSAKLHLVAEGKTWEDRCSSEFTLIRVARKS